MGLVKVKDRPHINRKRRLTMPWITRPGLNGKIYVPEQSLDPAKKYSCKDCFSCQKCGEDRCRVCRGHKAWNKAVACGHDADGPIACKL